MTRLQFYRSFLILSIACLFGCSPSPEVGWTIEDDREILQQATKFLDPHERHEVIFSLTFETHLIGASHEWRIVAYRSRTTLVILDSTEPEAEQIRLQYRRDITPNSVMDESGSSRTFPMQLADVSEPTPPRLIHRRFPGIIHVGIAIGHFLAS